MSSGISRLICVLVLAFGPANLCLCLSDANPVATKDVAAAHSCCKKAPVEGQQAPEKCKHCDAAAIVMSVKAERWASQIDMSLLPAFQLTSLGFATGQLDSFRIPSHSMLIDRPPSDLVHTSCQLTT